MKKIMGSDDDIGNHKKNLEESIKARPDVGAYLSKSGVVNREEFDMKVKETFVVWYGKEDASKANIKMSSTPLAEMDYEAIRKADPSKFGEYSMNPDRKGTEYIEKKEMPKIAKDLNKINEELQQKFNGKPRSEVLKYVVDTYGDKYRLPDMEDQEYIFSLPPDKVSEALKDGNWHYFVGSTLRGQNGDAEAPALRWDDERLDRAALWLGGRWYSHDRIVLLEK